MKLDKIKIGFQTYDITFDDEHVRTFNALGVTHKDKGLIVLAEDMSDNSLADTIIHEVLHAICNSYLPSLEGEEEVVTQMAHGLTQVIRDNPDFMKEIKKLL